MEVVLRANGQAFSAAPRLIGSMQKYIALNNENIKSDNYHKLLNLTPWRICAIKMTIVNECKTHYSFNLNTLFDNGSGSTSQQAGVSRSATHRFYAKVHWMHLSR